MDNPLRVMDITRLLSPLLVCLCFLGISIPQGDTYSDGSGHWCSRVQTRMVSCLQPTWSWHPHRRSEYNSRKYTVVYRQLKERKWRCCPGFHGDNCEDECFNCTSIRQLKERLDSTESIVRQMTYTHSAPSAYKSKDAQNCKCPRGPKGERGTEGREGPRGQEGRRGPPGPPGITLASAPDSGSGRTSIGSSGPVGAPGLPGSLGPVGPQGERGPRGEKGRPGPRGPPGKTTPADERREKDQESMISKMETRIEQLEGKVLDLEGELNSTRGAKDSLDILEARILLLEEIFPKLAGSPKTAALKQPYIYSEEIPDDDNLLETGPTKMDTSKSPSIQSDCACPKPPPPPPLPPDLTEFLFGNSTTVFAECRRLGYLQTLGHNFKELAHPSRHTGEASFDFKVSAPEVMSSACGRHKLGLMCFLFSSFFYL